jgi:hypothetical protein
MKMTLMDRIDGLFRALLGIVVLTLKDIEDRWKGRK